MIWERCSPSRPITRGASRECPMPGGVSVSGGRYSGRDGAGSALILRRVQEDSGCETRQRTPASLQDPEADSPGSGGGRPAGGAALRGN